MNRNVVVSLIAVIGMWGCGNDSSSPPSSGIAGTGSSTSTLPVTTAGTGSSVGTFAGTGAAAGTGAGGFAGTGVAGVGVGVGTAGISAGAAGASGVSGNTSGTSPSAAGAGGESVATAGSGATSGGAGASGSDSSSAGSGAAAGSGGSSGTEIKVPQACLKSPSNVVFIGDSYINYFVAHPELNGLVAADAIKDGALMMGQNYVDYAVAGTTIAAGAPQIPGQWTTAKAANKNIQVVVMDGGGNDVLINNPTCKADGSQNNAMCQMVVANTLAAGKMMITDMKASGVTEVVYMFYPHPPTGGAAIDDYTIPLLEMMCAGLSDDKFQCRVVDTVPIFNGHDDWYASDGIHANPMGEQAIADAIWMTLKSDCAAQASSSGCCTP